MVRSRRDLPPSGQMVSLRHLYLISHDHGKTHQSCHTQASSLDLGKVLDGIERGPVVFQSISALRLAERVAKRPFAIGSRRIEHGWCNPDGDDISRGLNRIATE